MARPRVASEVMNCGEAIRRLISAGVFLGLLAACGPSSSSEPPEPVALDVQMTDALVFEPSEIAVARGAEVTITATNAAAVALKHNLIILGGVFDGLGDINRAMQADPDIVVAETGLVEPGDSASLVVTFDEPGEYQFFCSVKGHHAAGMHGIITVEG